MASASSVRSVFARPSVARSLRVGVLVTTMVVLLASTLSIYTEMMPLLSDEVMIRDTAGAADCMNPLKDIAMYFTGDAHPPHHHDEDNDVKERHPPHHHDEDNDVNKNAHSRPHRRPHERQHHHHRHHRHHHNDKDRRHPPRSDHSLPTLSTTSTKAYTSAHTILTASIIIALVRTLMGLLLALNTVHGITFNVLVVLTTLLVPVHAIMLVCAFLTGACTVAVGDLCVALVLFTCSTAQWVVAMFSVRLPGYLAELEAQHGAGGGDAEDAENTEAAEDADALLAKTVSVSFDDAVDASEKPEKL